MILGTIRSVRSALTLATVAGTLALTACSPEVRTHGAMPSQSKLEQIEAGKSTRGDVAQLLGTPSTTSMFDNGETWYYIGSRQQQYAYHANEELERQILVLTFDRQGTLSDMKKLDKESGTEITLVKRTTPSAGHELTVIEQMLGNIGRFNSGTSGGK